MSRRQEKIAARRERMTLQRRQHEIREELADMPVIPSLGSRQATDRHHEADTFKRRIKPKRCNHASKPRDFIYTRTPNPALVRKS